MHPVLSRNALLLYLYTILLSKLKNLKHVDRGSIRNDQIVSRQRDQRVVDERGRLGALPAMNEKVPETQATTQPKYLAFLGSPRQPRVCARFYLCRAATNNLLSLHTSTWKCISSQRRFSWRLSDRFLNVCVTYFSYFGSFIKFVQLYMWLRIIWIFKGDLNCLAF